MDVRVSLWRKLSAEELMLLNCGVGEDSWESLGLQGDPSSRRSVLGVHWKDWCWSWNSSTLATSCEELTHWKRPWCWEGLEAGVEGDNRGWDAWMASPTQWTCVWVNSGSWWWTGRPGMLRFMGSQRARHDWATQLKWGPRDIAHCPCDMEALCVCVYACVLSRFSCVQLCTPMDCSTPKLFCPWGFSRQEYWSGLPCPPGDLPNPGIEPLSLMSPASAGGFFATGATRLGSLSVYTYVYSPYLQVTTHPPTLHSSTSCCSLIFPKGNSAMINSPTKIPVFTWQILPILPVGFPSKSWPAEPSIWIQKSILIEGTCYLDRPPQCYTLRRNLSFPCCF